MVYLQLSGSLSFNTYVTSIELPNNGSRPSDGANCTISGWVRTSVMNWHAIFKFNFAWLETAIDIEHEGSSNIPIILNKVDVPIVKDADCRSSHGPNGIKPGIICAGFQQG